MKDRPADLPVNRVERERSFIFDVAALVILSLILVSAYLYLSNIRSEERAANAVEASLLEAALILEEEAGADSGTYSELTAESSELLEDVSPSVRELVTVEMAETNEDSYCLEARADELAAEHAWAQASLASDQLEPETTDSC